MKFIIGAAGTGKTYTTIKGFENLNIKNKIACLAFTHSAVNNMKNYISEANAHKFEFQTLHKFFHLPIPFKYVKPNYKKINSYKYIVIDEFSLIPLDIINYLFEIFQPNTEKIIFIGDILQLPPIATEDEKSFNFKFFRNKDINLEIEYYLSNTIYCSNEYQQSDKMILTHNYRSNSHVMDILNDVFINQYIELTPTDFLKSEEINEYVILASEYSLLTKALRKSNFQGTYPTKIGCVNSNKCILNETLTTDFLNGDEVKITKIISPTEVEIIAVVNKSNCGSELRIQTHPDKLLPYNFITIHKAQGRGYDNIVLILDSLFEITMLYTGITRAKKNIKFITLSEPEKIEDKLIKNINQFNKLKELVYCQ